MEPVGAPVERFRCWRPSVVGPHLLLCGAVRPVLVEQWRVQSAKCKVQAGSEVLAIAGGRDAALYTRVTGLLCSSALYRHIHKDNDNDN